MLAWELLKTLDNAVAILILGLWLAGSIFLLAKSAASRPEDRRSIFSCGVLALVPERWRRWLLDENPQSPRG